MVGEFTFICVKLFVEIAGVMKKWLVLFLLLVIVLIGAIYLLTRSARRPVNESVHIRVTARGGFREIYNQQNWRKWWPGEQLAENLFRFRDYEYRVTDKQLSSLTIMISGNGDSVASRLNLVVSGIDSLGIVWTTPGAVTSHLLTRLPGKPDHQLRDDIAALLDKMRVFYSDEENIYGFRVERIQVPDTSMVSVSRVVSEMPSTTFIYGLIDELHHYISARNVAETNKPMLNISKSGDSLLVRVAIPINQHLPDSDDIRYRRMLPGGTMCVATIPGGPATALNGLAAMEEYLKDHDMKQPAIPYLSLVTDRRNEPDTSRWITKVYCPYF